MVYGRAIGERELTFEASGALWDASLVMRDRETDSWWSIITASAVGGALAGTPLAELPGFETATWGEWRSRHPATRVLSMDGVQHVERDPYADYLASEKTFRDLAVDDDRLPPKAAIFAFLLDGAAWAVPHETLAGGRLVAADDGAALLLHRRPGASLRESTRAWRVAPGAAAEASAEALVPRAMAGAEGFEPLPGIDTFWYIWASVHERPRLVR